MSQSTWRKQSESTQVYIGKMIYMPHKNIFMNSRSYLGQQQINIVTYKMYILIHKGSGGIR